MGNQVSGVPTQREWCPGKKGDVLRFPLGPSGYWHYAIVYDEYRVIHVTGEKPPADFSGLVQANDHFWRKCSVGSLVTTIEVEEYSAVRGSRNAELAPKPLSVQTVAFDGEEVVRRAEDIRQHSRGEVDYNLAMQNCEHFANHCRYGVEVSQQVLTTMDCVLVGLLFAVGAGWGSRPFQNFYRSVPKLPLTIVDMGFTAVLLYIFRESVPETISLRSCFNIINFGVMTLRPVVRHVLAPVIRHMLV